MLRQVCVNRPTRLADQNNHMHRRELLLLLGFSAALGALPGYAFAAEGLHSGKSYRLGWLAPRPRDPDPNSAAGRLVKRAAELGWIEGQNILIDYRHFATVDEARKLADELVRAKVDLLIAQAPPAILAARKATTSIPIVMIFAGNVIEAGIVKSLRRPGGNITGLSYDTGHEWSGKALQLTRELLPQASRIACLWNIENDSHRPESPYRLEFEKVAPSLRLTPVSKEVRTTEDIARAIGSARQERADALLVPIDPFTLQNRRAIMDAAHRHRLPVIALGDWGFDGAILAYGPRTRHIPARAAEYIDRILRGTPPGELPIEQPTEFDLIVDAKAAKLLGLKIPSSLLLRADRIVE